MHLTCSHVTAKLQVLVSEPKATAVESSRLPVSSYSEQEHNFKFDLKVCDHGTLAQVYIPGHCPWSCFYLKHSSVYTRISKHNVSETGVCLRLQVKPTQLGPIDRASPYFLRQNPVSETLCFEI
jgi:hypothetical protein